MLTYLRWLLRRCTNCGGRLDEDWPDGEGGFICQACWEAECDRTWWDAVVACELLAQTTGDE